MNRADLLESLSRTPLNDPSNTRFLMPDLEEALQSALRLMVKLKPSIFTVTETVELQPGAVQMVPEGSDRLVEVHRNMGADGQTPGHAIRQVSYDLLRNMIPLWSEAEGDGKITEFAWDDREPRKFYVYPPVAAGDNIHIELSHVAAPSSESQAIPVPDADIEAVRHYVLYRAYDIDTGAGSVQKASGHYQAFMMLMGASQESMALTAPVRSGGG